MLQERDELLYGDSIADIAEFLRFSWPLELSRFDSIDIDGESKLIVWFNVEAGSAAASRKDDPADVMTFVPTAEARWRQSGSRRMICSCGSDLHELVAGHQLKDDGSDAWIVVGTRCVECGLLSSPVDWNVE
jgi:hypothetical protein